MYLRKENGDYKNMNEYFISAEMPILESEFERAPLLTSPSQHLLRTLLFLSAKGKKVISTVE